jgi:hypothetical protein
MPKYCYRPFLGRVYLGVMLMLFWVELGALMTIANHSQELEVRLCASKVEVWLNGKKGFVCHRPGGYPTARRKLPPSRYPTQQEG